MKRGGSKTGLSKIGLQPTSGASRIEEFLAIATMIGMIIGAGIFGIPYVVQQAGFFTGILVILIVGILMMLTYLMFGEVVLSTKGNHQLTGYTEKYLGKKLKFLMFICLIASMYGALFAYLIGIGNSLSTILGGNWQIYSIIFLILAGTLLYFGLKTFGKTELIFNLLILLIISAISLILLPQINLNNFSGFNLSKFFIPYGVVLFAFLGTTAVPIAKEILVRNKKKLKKSIILAVSIPLIIYILFSIIVIGITGKDTTNIATIGLGNSTTPLILILGNLLAVFAMTTSFLAVGVSVKEMFNYDYKISKFWSWTLTLIFPILFFIFLRNTATFSNVLDITGVFGGGISLILMTFMFFKAKKLRDRTPEYQIKAHYWLGTILILLFSLGILFKLI